MEQTISSLIFKCQMAAQLCRYLIIAKKRVHSQPVYVHFSGVGAYTGSQCMCTERVNLIHDISNICAKYATNLGDMR
jgi:hypothetical protein